MSWLLSHAINPKLAQAVGVTGELGGEIRFPYTRPDGSTFTRTRTPDGRTLQPRGEPLRLWWPCGGRAADTILLCEGEGDTLAAASVLCDDEGEPRGDLPEPLLGLCPVGLPGTPTPPARVGMELATHKRTVFLALDADDAGRAATVKLTVALTERGITVFPVVLPDGSDLADNLAMAAHPTAQYDPSTWLAKILAAHVGESIRREILATNPAKPKREPREPQEHDDLKDIETATYIAKLTGEEVPPSGFISCPFPHHTDNDPSFQVYPGNRGWYCWSACGKGGDIYSFVMELRGVDFKEAKAILADTFPSSLTAEALR